METLSQAIVEYDARLKATRAQELSEIANRLHQIALNVPCDVSATAPEQVIGFKAGHKQARHKIADEIMALFYEYYHATETAGDGR